ncbi:hypothetical protein J5N97_012631 [Dioscorea zingiberensis]|uniref:Uncharacterized protein n=1 Tax=Dioscorea zingiberensis TaxID=325984 RepID=A0A9D5CRE5_9LILI|nr:hypothetical protein J5N97_012631 [Dioscorea zingiberensis]
MAIGPRVSGESTSSSPSHSAKVSDRIVKLLAIDPAGEWREVIGLTDQTLLKALTNAGLIDPASHRLEEIDAFSAECEVHIAQEWLDKLPPPSYGEKYVMTRNSRNRVLNNHARLGCQVVLSHDLQGIREFEENSLIYSSVRMDNFLLFGD